MASKEVLESAVDESRFFYGHLIVLVAFFMMILIFGTYYSFGVFFKPVLNEFGWSRTMTSGAFSLSSIMNGVLGIAMGWFTDKFGPRMVMTLCGLLLGLGYCLMSHLGAIWQLYVFYGLIIGAGMGGSYVPLMSTVARWFVRQRGMMTGIVAAGIGIGALIGPPAANRLISAYGWRISLAILGTIVLASVALSAQLLRRDPVQGRQMAYDGNETIPQGLTMRSEGLSLREAVGAMQFWIISAMLFCFGFCIFAILVHIAAHAVELGFSATSAASILAIIGGLSIIGKVVLGKVADIIGGRRTFGIGFFLMSISLLWLFPSKAAWALFLFGGVFGFAYGGNVVSLPPLAAMLFGLRLLGLILGVLNLSFVIGGAFGPLVTGYIFDITYRYQLAFLVCAGISIAGLILTLALEPRRLKSDIGF